MCSLAGQWCPVTSLKSTPNMRVPFFFLITGHFLMKLKETCAAAGLSGPVTRLLSAKCMLKSKPKAKQAKPRPKGFPHFLNKKLQS